MGHGDTRFGRTYREHGGRMTKWNPICQGKMNIQVDNILAVYPLGLEDRYCFFVRVTKVSPAGTVTGLRMETIMTDQVLQPDRSTARLTPGAVTAELLVLKRKRGAHAGVNKYTYPCTVLNRTRDCSVFVYDPNTVYEATYYVR